MARQFSGHERGQSPILKAGKPLLDKSLIIGAAHGGQGCVLIDEADGNPRWVSDAKLDICSNDISEERINHRPNPNAKARQLVVVFVT